MNEPNLENCHACQRSGSASCSFAFVCTSCGITHNVCSFLPGGFAAYERDGGGECSICLELRIMDEAWIDRWIRKKKPRKEAG